MSMDQDELYNLLLSYQTPSKVELNKTLDAVKQLVDDEQISEQLGRDLIRILISMNIHQEISSEIRTGQFPVTPKSLKFMNFKYGRTHETYA